MSAFAGLAQARANIASAAKAAGYRSEPVVPEQVNPPLVVAAPAEPYITGGDTFEPDLFRCNFDVFCIVGNKVNKAMANDLDRMVQGMIRFLGDWHIAAVNEPFVGVANGRKLFMTRIRINALFTLTED